MKRIKRNRTSSSVSRYQYLLPQFPVSGIHQNVLQQQYGIVPNWEMRNVTRSSKDIILRLKKWKTLEGHTGCVNTIAWNTSGTLLLSGSDDFRLNIYNGYSYNLVHSIQSGHQANIFSAKFLPCTSDTKMVSCSGDGILQYNELGGVYGANSFNCHSATTYEVAVTPGDPNTFLSCGEDGTVRMFDLRTKTKCLCQECRDDILIDMKHGITSMCTNPLSPFQLAVGCKDSYVYLFDCRTLGTTSTTRSSEKTGSMSGLFCKFKPQNLRKDASCRITSVHYSNDGNTILVSYCADYVYAFAPRDETGTYLDTTVKEDNYVDLGAEPANEPDTLPPVKRLRLRGDWSDTGPQASPENVGDNDVSANNLIQRMSVLFSAWVDDVINSAPQVDNSDDSDTHDVVSQSGNDMEADSVVEMQSSNNSKKEKEDATELLDEAEGGSMEDKNESLKVIASANGLPGTEIVLGDKDINSSVDDVNMNDKHMVNKKGDENEKAQVENQKYSSGNPTENVSHLHSATESTNLDETAGNVSEKGFTSTSTYMDESDSIPSDTQNAQVSCTETSNAEFSHNDRSHTHNDELRQKAASRIQKFMKEKVHKPNFEQFDDSKSKPVFISQYYKSYKGHRNARTMIKEANFWGDDYILSGSDCGRIFIWDRHTSELIMFLQADSRVVNCVQPHPHDPILASSGIDHNIKIWAPLASEMPDLSDMNEIIERNEQMLKKSCDTITVPASFVLRMLASFRSRRGPSQNLGNTDNNDDDDDDDDDDDHDDDYAADGNEANDVVTNKLLN